MEPNQPAGDATGTQNAAPVTGDGTPVGAAPAAAGVPDAAAAAAAQAASAAPAAAAQAAAIDPVKALADPAVKAEVDKLTKAAADKVIADKAAADAKASTDYKAKVDADLAALKADPDFAGGDQARFDAQLKVAQAAVEHYGGAEFKKFLNETGMGNHPDLIRAFAKIGRNPEMRGKVVGDTGRPAAGSGGTFDDRAKRFYGGSSA